MEWHKNGIYAVFMQEISMRTENFVVNPRKIRPDDLIQSSGRSVLIVGTNFFCASEVPILASFFLDEAEYRSVFCCLSNWLLAGCPVFSPLRSDFLWLPVFLDAKNGFSLVLFVILSR